MGGTLGQTGLILKESIPCGTSRCTNGLRSTALPDTLVGRTWDLGFKPMGDEGRIYGECMAFAASV